MKKYINAELELISFGAGDVIATSTGMTNGGTVDPNDPAGGQGTDYNG